jgi:hypothetical protein
MGIPSGQGLVHRFKADIWTIYSFKILRNYPFTGTLKKFIPLPIRINIEPILNSVARLK